MEVGAQEGHEFDFQAMFDRVDHLHAVAKVAKAVLRQQLDKMMVQK